MGYKSYDYSLDMWSVGCMVASMACLFISHLFCDMNWITPFGRFFEGNIFSAARITMINCYEY